MQQRQFRSNRALGAAERNRRGNPYSGGHCHSCIAGIYTTALPLLWTGIIKLAEEGTKKYKRLTVIGGILGFLIGFLPYKSVLNVLYGVNGYLGFLLIIFMIWHDVRERLSHNQS